MAEFFSRWASSITMPVHLICFKNDNSCCTVYVVHVRYVACISIRSLNHVGVKATIKNSNIANCIITYNILYIIWDVDCTISTVRTYLISCYHNIKVRNPRFSTKLYDEYHRNDKNERITLLDSKMGCEGKCWLLIRKIKDRKISQEDWYVTQDCFQTNVVQYSTVQHTAALLPVNSLPTKVSLSSVVPCKTTVFAPLLSFNSFCQCRIVDKGTTIMKGPGRLHFTRRHSMNPTACIVLPVLCRYVSNRKRCILND